MQRKEFIKQTSILAIGMGAFGKLQWNNDHFAGDTSPSASGLAP